MIPGRDLGNDTQRNAANVVQVVAQKWGARAFLRANKRGEVPDQNVTKYNRWSAPLARTGTTLEDVGAAPSFP